MGKELTLNMIIQRTRSDKFDSIKNLNVWGNDLDDISIIRELPNLEVLSLSVNHITSLKEFAACPRLTELYLRKNDVADLSEVQYLTSLKHLRVLWLWDNPCSQIPNYRPIVIKLLPYLAKLDNTEITPEEREAAAKASIDFSSEEESCPRERMEAYPQVKRESPAQERVKPVAREYLKKKSEPVSVMMDCADERPIAVKRQKTLQASSANEDYTQENKSENILCAVLALLKELDVKGLELVKRDVDRKIAAKR